MRGARGRLEWNGDRVSFNMAAAAAKGINKVMAACVAEAKSGHLPGPKPSIASEEFHNQTSELMNSIRIFEFVPEHPHSHYVGWVNHPIITGSWGSDLEYALFVEIGTSTYGWTAEERVQTAHGDANSIAPPFGPKMAARHTLYDMKNGVPINRDEGYMRPAADKFYPELARIVREEHEKLAATNPHKGTALRGTGFSYLGGYAL